ncbi:MAG: transglycosylase domain-containing protein [Acidimicrobiales bacterium]
MRRWPRLLAIVCAGGVVVTVAAASMVAVGTGLWSGAANATDVPLAPLSTSLRQGSTVYAADGKTVLAVLHDSVNQKPVTLDQVAPVLIHAVLDTEAAHFYIHGGVDLPSTIRALSSNSSSAGRLQGGSTITQQLVKNVYLTPQRKLSRKIKEAVLAQRLEQQYSKDQILEAYLSVIYLGNGAYGVESAANQYFDVSARDVSLSQAALIAGLIQDPNGYDPLAHPNAARVRRAEVLGRMVHYGHINKADADAANAEPIPTALTQPAHAADTIDDYYVQEVKSELLGPNSPIGGNYQERYAALFEGGLKIYTNLDPDLQYLAEQKSAADTPRNSGGYQEAMVVIDPPTGKVRAMVGGLDYNQSKFDVVTQGLRQPGSGFKVFTLLAALQQGFSPYDTVDGSSPCGIDFPTDHDLVTKAPAHNDEGNGGGVESLIQATAQSTNCAFMRLAHEVGLPNVINMAHSLGITGDIPPFPSIVIGSYAVPPIQMAAAYATVADDGVYHKPSFIDHVVDNTGATVLRGGDSGHRVISPQVTREAMLAFEAVVAYGTGAAAALPDRQAAGKTGTTENNADAWFNGFVPQMEATVWMGNLVGEKAIQIPGYGQVFGGTFPAETWHDFMIQALAGAPAVPFPLPDYSQIPPGTYIDSPSLRKDDHTGHNQAPPPTTIPPPTTTPPTTTSTTTTSATTTPTSTPTATTTPQTTPVTTSPSTSPPAT